MLPEARRGRQFPEIRPHGSYCDLQLRHALNGCPRGFTWSTSMELGPPKPYQYGIRSPKIKMVPYFVTLWVFLKQVDVCAAGGKARWLAAPLCIVCSTACRGLPDGQRIFSKRRMWLLFCKMGSFKRGV